jgi:uncharacterized Fe-S cluster-containing protein
MRIALLLCALLGGACGKSRCEKYAEMELRCGDYPTSEEDITRKLAQGTCESSDEIGEIGARIAKEADCAEKFFKKSSPDCAGYQQCTDAIK